MNTARTSQLARSLVILGVAAALLFAGPPINQLCAESIPVPNGDFETLYSPGTAIEGNISTDGYSQGVGPACPIDGGEYEFDDATTGDEADIPGWIGAQALSWVDHGGTYGRDETTGNLQGSITTQQNHTDGGIQAYIANGGGWGNPAGGLIVSAAPLADVEADLIYTLSFFARGGATPLQLDLLAGGLKVTPTSSVDPVLSGDWQEFSRTYNAASLADYVGLPLRIQLGVGRGASGGQSGFDDVSLTVVPEPSTSVLAFLGLLSLAWYGWRRR